MYRELIRKLQNILKVFRIDDEWLGFEEVTMGHINHTYRVYTLTKEQKEKSYMVQNLNLNVFKNPLIAMDNIDKVICHIRNKEADKTLHFHHTAEGKIYHLNEDGCWRLYTRVEGIAINTDTDEEIMNSVGRAFSHFQYLLSDLDATKLQETIPDFHNTQKRYEHLLASIEEDKFNRVKDCSGIINFAKAVAPLALEIYNHNLENAFPIRVTHNDTKCNNVLIADVTHEPKCVIDLDTVMPGLIMHDFGDAIRFGANKAKEDEKDVTKVSLSIPLYKAFTEGFLSEIYDVLTPDEISYMAKGAFTMTFECAIRFLDDYLNGDTYFKIKYPRHNYVRAKCQFYLLKDMLGHMDEMNQIVVDTIKKYKNK